MFGVEFIEVAIGLVFGFLAISAICSGIVEIFNKLTHVKAKHLKKALGQLLDDPNYNGFVKDLYNHHLISSPLAKSLGEPEYIESKDFARAVFDILGGAAESALYRSMVTKVEKMPDGNPKTDLLKILNASPEDIKAMREDVAAFFGDPDFQMAAANLIASYAAGSNTYKALYARITNAEGTTKENLLKILNAQPSDVGGMATDIHSWFGNAAFDEAFFDLLAFGSKEMHSYEAIEARVNTIQDETVRKRLLSILESSATGLESMQAKVEDWFNTTMTQVSDWYRRKMRVFVTAVSVVVVVSLNADSVRLAQELWYDDQFREATVSAASEYAQNPPQYIAPVPDAMPGIPVSVPDSGKASNDSSVTDSAGRSASPSTATNLPDTSKLEEPGPDLYTFSNLLDTLARDIEAAQVLPIGWKSEPLPWQASFPKDTDKTWWWIAKIFGLLITIGAVSFGSTYWYSQLKSLLNLRFNMTGKQAGNADKKDESS